MIKVQVPPLFAIKPLSYFQLNPLTFMHFQCWQFRLKSHVIIYSSRPTFRPYVRENKCLQKNILGHIIVKYTY